MSLIIYTTPSCTSCRKTKKWFDDYYIPYEEKCLLSGNLAPNEVENILKVCNNSFLDKRDFKEIISARSVAYKIAGVSSLDDLNQDEIRDLIIENPSVLKRPIILDTEQQKIQIGFNEEEIREFIPRKINDAIVKYFMGQDYLAGLTVKEGTLVDKLIKNTFKKKKPRAVKRSPSDVEFEEYDDDNVDELESLWEVSGNIIFVTIINRNFNNNKSPSSAGEQHATKNEYMYGLFRTLHY
jgi:regulatory protein spx